MKVHSHHATDAQRLAAYEKAAQAASTAGAEKKLSKAPAGWSKAHKVDRIFVDAGVQYAVIKGELYSRSFSAVPTFASYFDDGKAPKV